MKYISFEFVCYVYVGKGDSGVSWKGPDVPSWSSSLRASSRPDWCCFSGQSKDSWFFFSADLIIIVLKLRIIFES